MEPAPDNAPPTVPRARPVVAFLLRTALFAALAYAVFGWLLIPVPVRSPDMLPTYKPGSVTFCFRPGAWFRKPAPGAVVFVRAPGGSRLLLRRVVAVAGDSVGFAAGRLIVNGRFLSEPYAAEGCTWTLAPAVVRPECVFVVGDNRSAPPAAAPFGQVPASAVVGSAVW